MEEGELAAQSSELEPADVREYLEEPHDEIALVEGVRVVPHVRSAPPTLVQAAAAAATGFVAGAATIAVLNRRRTAPALGSRRRVPTLVPQGDTQTFLVQVRTLRRG